MSTDLVNPIVPGDRPLKKVGLNRSDLLDWLKPYMMLRDQHQVEDLCLWVSHAAIGHLMLNSDNFSSPQELLGFKIYVHNHLKPDGRLMSVYQGNHKIETVELVDA